MVAPGAPRRRIARLSVLIATLSLLSSPSFAHATAGWDEIAEEPPPELRPVRIAVLVDESGSLSAEDIARERNAARLIVQGEPSDKSTVSVIGFASAEGPGQTPVDPVCPPTTLDSLPKRDGVGKCVGELKRRDESSGDGTDHVTALRAALDDLSSPGGEGQSKIVFLLTDGKLDVGESPTYPGNTPEARNAAARDQLPGVLNELKRSGVSVWPLGFGRVDRAQLESFASGAAQERCGQKTPAPRATVISGSADLMRAMSDASRAARCVNVDGPVTGELAEDDSVDLSVNVPAIASEGSIIVYKGDPRITVTYHDPDGVTAPANGTAGASRFSRSGQGADAEALRIVNPVPGRWTVRLLAPPGVSAREVSAVASFQGAVRAVISVRPVVPRPGEQVDVTMQVQGSRGPITEPADLRDLAFTTELNGDGFSAVAPVELGDQGGNGQYHGSLTVPASATGNLEFVGSVGGVGVSRDQRSFHTEVAGAVIPVAGVISLDDDSDVRPGDELDGTVEISNSTGEARTVRLEVVEPSDGAVVSVSKATFNAPVGHSKHEFTLKFDDDTTLGANQARLRLVDAGNGALVGELLFSRDIVTWWEANWWWVALVAVGALGIVATLMGLVARRVRRARADREVRGLRVELRRDGEFRDSMTASRRGTEYSFVVCRDGEDGYRLAVNGDGDRYRLRRSVAGPVLHRGSSQASVTLPVDLGDGCELVVHDRSSKSVGKQGDRRVPEGGGPSLSEEIDAYSDQG